MDSECNHERTATFAITWFRSVSRRILNVGGFVAVSAGAVWFWADLSLPFQVLVTAILGICRGDWAACCSARYCSTISCEVHGAAGIFSSGVPTPSAAADPLVGLRAVWRGMEPRQRFAGIGFGSSMEDYRAARLAALARFAEAFFSTFICVQLAAVMLLTPAYTAGAIADEKDRKTLEFVLATDLRNREIVLGKLVACMANIALLVLTGLPVLSLMQLLGGVDPNLVLAGYTVTGLTIVSLASVSILISVYSQKARDAIVLSYLILFAYMLVSSIADVLASHLKVRSATGDEIILGIVLDAFASGNLLVMLGQLKWAWIKGTPLTSIIPGLLVRYALVHGLLSLICTAWAVWRLRAVALRTPRRKVVVVERYAQAKRRFVLPLPGGLTFYGIVPRLRPRLRLWLGRQPMVWKEVFAEPGMSFGWVGR